MLVQSYRCNPVAYDLVQLTYEMDSVTFVDKFFGAFGSVPKWQPFLNTNPLSFILSEMKMETL